MTIKKSERFKDVPEAHPIHGGKMWVSQVSPDRLIFAGLDHLTLTVAEARKLRDWLTGVLPI